MREREYKNENFQSLQPPGTLFLGDKGKEKRVTSLDWERGHLDFNSGIWSSLLGFYFRQVNWTGLIGCGLGFLRKRKNRIIIC